MQYEHKLFLLLIVLVVFPCIVLSLFALQALEGQKAIIEKKIEESYKALAQVTYKSIISRVKSKESIVKKVLQRRNSIGSTPSIPLLSAPLEDLFFDKLYVINQNFQVRYPEIRSASKHREEFTPNNYSLFERAYYFEFQKQDYLSAIEEYQKVVAETKDQKMEAIGYALVAIARCNRKADRIDKSLENYQSIITLFLDRLDARGFNFVANAKKEITQIYYQQEDYELYYRSLVNLLEFVIRNELRLYPPFYRYNYDETTEKLKAVENEIRLPQEVRNQIILQRDQLLQKQQQYIRNEKEVKLLEKFLIPQMETFVEKNNDTSGYLDYRIGDEQFLAYFHEVRSREGHRAGFAIYSINLSYCLRDIVVPVLQSQGGRENILLTIIDQRIQPVVGSIPTTFELWNSETLSPIFPFWHLGIYLKDTSAKITEYRSGIHRLSIMIVIFIAIIGIIITIVTFIREVKNARLKSDFVSNVTHELKTPLTAIQMAVDTLLMGRIEKEEDSKEFLSVIARETNRLRERIERILNFAKMNRRRRKFHFYEESMQEIIEEVVEGFRQQIHENPNLEIDVQIAPDLPSILVDRSAIMEAISNLLSNAYKYTDKAKKEIAIVCHKRGEQTIVISVKDNGMGIPGREIGQVFQEFYRIETSERRHIEGSGLGLSLVDSIVKAHKGRIKIQSKVGTGTEIRLILPLTPSTEKG